MVVGDGILYSLSPSRRESLGSVLKPKDTDTRGGMRHGGGQRHHNCARAWAAAVLGWGVMTSLLGLLLPLGLGAAISPFPTTICIMLLSTRKPLMNAFAFLIGYSVVLVAVGVFAFAVFGNGGGGGSEPSDRSVAVKGTIDAVFGVLFLILALKMWLKATDPNAPPPRWMAGVSSISTGEAFLFGLIMMGTNFTSLPLYISGLKEIVTANIGTARSIFALTLFILLVVVELLVPVVAYALAPRRAGVLLGAARQWLEKNNRVITIFVFVVFGILLLVRGITALVG
jgi:hypothetical protein